MILNSLISGLISQIRLQNFLAFSSSQLLLLPQWLGLSLKFFLALKWFALQNTLTPWAFLNDVNSSIKKVIASNAIT